MSSLINRLITIQSTLIKSSLQYIPCRSCTNELVRRKFYFDDDEDENFIPHIPTMPNELVKLLNPQDGQVFVDMTFGSGGHSKHLLATGKDIRIIAMDRDPLAFKCALRLSEQTKGQVIPLLAKFSELPGILAKNGFKKDSINGIIMELGPSSMQMNDPKRGFSFSKEGPLDMRMDGKRFAMSITADDVVNTLDVEALTKIFKVYGEEKLAAKYANAIIDCRFMMKKISTTTELANLVDSLTADKLISDISRTRTSATKVFQALRIFVNNEFNELNYAITKMRDYLYRDEKTVQLCQNNLDNTKALEDEISQSVSGKMAVISFTALEDTLVKRHLQGIELDNPLTYMQQQKFISNLHKPTEQEMAKFLTKKWFSLTKFATTPSQEEIVINPKSYPAKMRVALRVL